MLTKMGLQLGLGLAACLFGMSNVLAYGLYYVGSDAACGFTDIQQAIDAATDPEGNTIFIAQDLVYSNQALVITDRSVSILGGLATCDAVQYIGTTAITGTSGHSVFEIEGNSHVYLANLAISGAVMDEDHSGGGIYFGGFGSLELANTVVNNNQAGYGGGIDMSPSGGHADLTLDTDTLIIENTALVSGGGIRIEGDTRLYVLQPQTHIKLNHALDGYGGGIEVLTPARADIGSPGYDGNAVVQFNDAVNGGGIALVGQGFDSNNPFNSVQIFTTDAFNPVQIADNIASQAGGGIYIEATDDSEPVQACVYDFRIHDNMAPDGAAIYAEGTSNFDSDGWGAEIVMNRPGTSACSSDAPPALGAVACAAGIPCNEVVDNISEDSGGGLTSGSTIRGVVFANLRADRLVMQGNEGGHAIAIEGGYVTELSNCLLAANSDEGELISAYGGGGTSDLHVDDCTITDNVSNAAQVIYSNQNFVEIISSIFDQPGQQVIDFSGAQGDLTAQYVLATNVSTLVGGVGLVDGEPDFVDRANGDYHLQRTSLGVDFAPALGGSDLDRNPRTVDLLDIPNGPGPMDLGAYEIQNQIVGCARSDTIFCNGFDGL